jgi:hypothetical protein
MRRIRLLVLSAAVTLAASPLAFSSSLGPHLSTASALGGTCCYPSQSTCYILSADGQKVLVHQPNSYYSDGEC